MSIPFEKLQNEQLIAIMAEFTMYNTNLKDIISSRNDPLVDQMYPKDSQNNDKIDLGSFYNSHGNQIEQN